MTLTRLLICLFFIAPMFAQTAKTGSLVGSVKNSVTGEPVKDALIVAQRLPGLSQPVNGNPESTGMVSKGVLSHSGGGFRIDGLPEGNYFYEVQKPGYATHAEYHAPIAISSGSSSASLEISIAPLGTIEGRVVNQYNEPLDKIALDVFSSRTFDGENNPVNVGTTWTDNRGNYHLAWLEPGKYFIKAQGRRGGTEIHAAIDRARIASWEGFMPVYYGGGTDIDSAIPVTVGVGTRSRADFRLDMQPSARIGGKVQGYAPNETVNFQLLASDGLVQPSRALFDPTTGEFQVLDVTPGTYTLRAEEDKARSEFKVTVSDGDVQNIFITLAPPITITGTVRNVNANGGVLPRSSCRMSLHVKGTQDYAQSSEENGKLTILNVYPGAYRVSLGCVVGYLVSARFGTTDLLTSRTITVAPGEAVPSIEMEYAAPGGIVKVMSPVQAARVGAILLVPASNRRDSFREQVFEPGIGTTFRDLAPGDYSAYALPELGGEFEDPAFLRSLSGGVSVHAEDGKTTEVTLGGIAQ